MFYVFKHFQEGKLAEMAEGLERGRGSSADATGFVCNCDKIKSGGVLRSCEVRN